ncbi:MAG: D-inositol-3-phosphate glycosyltransferase [Acidimicrobiales bacterium]|nr:MAG: glycosyltransferase WbuB [Actinomycetota bacterium]MBV6509838.1 D-inositol-3-phosphate glycosyltransferase [Acidimicrobiales bacterium]RIK03361.1 MAG: glycosyltransferase WbuB [Acidobacteriota bacterium]
MNIVVICPHFAPDLAPTGEVMTRIVEELAARGHRLHVVTSLPWYERHRIEPGWEGSVVRHDEVPWGVISRVHPFPTDKTNIPARAAAFGGFTALTTFVALLTRLSPDVVLAMSPPLTLGVAGWLAARRHRVPFVFNIQDVFPDVAVELGAITDRRVISFARWLERFTYFRADAVTVLSDDLRENVAAKLAGDRPDRVVVIPNFVDTDRIAPGSPDNDYRGEFDLSGKRVVMYAGNVGMSQSLDLMLEAAATFTDDPDIRFVINGSGAARPGLIERARGLENVVFVGMQPRERLSQVLAAADIHVVPLKTGLARSSVPSKLYSILAAGRPVVASVDAGTEVARVVDGAGAGVCVPPEDAEAFTKALAVLLQDDQQRAAMGRRGRSFVEGWASPAAVARRYEDLFAQVAEERRAGSHW